MPLQPLPAPPVVVAAAVEPPWVKVAVESGPNTKFLDFREKKISLSRTKQSIPNSIKIEKLKSDGSRGTIPGNFARQLFRQPEGVGVSAVPGASVIASAGVVEGSTESGESHIARLNFSLAPWNQVHNFSVYIGSGVSAPLTLKANPAAAASLNAL